MIIVTGMDNTGKTTLVKKLSTDLGFPVMKSPGKGSWWQQRDWLGERLIESETVKRYTIFDRFVLLEELVYGPILRGKSNFSLLEVVAFLKYLSPLVVYTRPSTKKIMEFGDREQMEGVIERSLELIKAYDEVIFKLMNYGINIQVYDYEVNSGDYTYIINYYLAKEGLEIIRGNGQ